VKPLTLKSLNVAIARSELEFSVSHTSAVAERIARLHRFNGYLAARKYATGVKDWMTPEDFAENRLHS
jgi:hypothetical protein